MTDLNDLKETLVLATMREESGWDEMEIEVPYLINILKELIEFKEENQ